MPWAAAAGAVAGAAINASASRSAANTQAAAANQAALAQEAAAGRATDAWNSAVDASLRAQQDALGQYRGLTQDAYDTALQQQQDARARLDSGTAAYRNAGTDAVSQLQALMNYDPTPTAASVMAQPGYQFGLQQGLNATQNSAAAAGGLYSGQALKELTQYGNDYATTKYGQAFDQAQTAFGNRWNRIAALAGLGQQAQSSYNAGDQSYANNIGNLATNNAQRQGSALLDAAGNATSLYTSRANALGNLATGTANNLGNIWTSNANAQAAAALQQGAIASTGINQLAGLAAYGLGNSGSSATAANVAAANQSSDPIGTLGYLQGNLYSDRRLKTDVVRIGTRPDGLGVYRFRYVWGGPLQVGLMAQEVQQVHPEAVSEIGGFLAVDYSRV